MLVDMPSDRAPIPRLAVLFAAGWLVVNAAFFFLSGNYFESHHQVIGGASVPTFSPEQANHVRVVFAMMSGVVTAVALVASTARRAVGHVLAAVLGMGNLVLGFLAFTHAQPGALTATLLV